MANILVAGAGKSATWLIKFLLDEAVHQNWTITVADGNASLLSEKVGRHRNARAVAFDITSASERQQLVQNADIVLSLMPPHLHALLAKDCLQFKKHLITSSYISPEIKGLDLALKDAGIMAMCEMGLDPGIDHMTAHQIIHNIHKHSGQIVAFSSYCGGLVAPVSDDNPWHYKFSWNPRNIIDAGKAGAAYLKNGSEVEVDYGQMFQDNGSVGIAGLGNLAWYANRDSLKYLDSYEIPDVKSFLRATLRYPAFCTGWNALIRLGITSWDDQPDDTIKTYADWMGALSGSVDTNASIFRKIADKLDLAETSSTMGQLAWLGLFDETPLPEARASHADILLQLLEQKWAMKPTDKDMVVMQHEVSYHLNGKHPTLISSMVLEGENRELSAMAKTVGLPMGLLAKGILDGSIAPVPGVHIPNMPEVYQPVLRGLEAHGIRFIDKIV